MATFTRHYPNWPPFVPKSLSVPRTSVYYNLEVSATRYPDKAAIDYYGAEVSYSRLKREVDALAGWLQQRCGVKTGDRVLLYAQNGVHFIAGYYGILRADAVVVPVNPMNLTEELEHYVEDAGARVLITTQELASRATPLVRPGLLDHLIVGAHSEYLPPQTDLPVPEFVRASSAVRWRRERRAQDRMTWLSCRIHRVPRESPKAACTRIRRCLRRARAAVTGVAHRAAR